LYEKLLKPLESSLGNCTTLLLVPDGNLHHLPFASLVDRQGKYLVESYQCSYVSSARDLLRPQPSSSGQGVVIVADPDYNLGVEEWLKQAARLKQPDPQGNALAVRGPSLQSRGGLKWKRLQATATEAADVEELLKAAGWQASAIEVHLDANALEERVKLVRSPQILHLATHGEFLKKPGKEGEEPSPGREPGLEAQMERVDNPLLRSFLVFAGSNRADERPPDKARLDDGLLTAEEVALLDLRGTELVVLSACKSGLGDVHDSEGVYGLRRAFLYAGARTLVTTLFIVPSDASAELMKSFYTHLASGKGKLEALHQAQKDMIRERREKGGAAHPFFWASFTLIGETGPLSKGQ
jgi:CHAT domain-containing protein